MYWSLPRDRVEELFEDEVEEGKVAADAVIVKEADVETAKKEDTDRKDDDAPPSLERLSRTPTLVRAPPLYSSWYYTVQRRIPIYALVNNPPMEEMLCDGT